MTDEKSPGLAKWERHTEWPLAAVATALLVVYSIEVLAEPPDSSRRILEVILKVTYGVFIVDYVARLVLANNRRNWFFRHLIDLAVAVLPFLRPLRLLRLLVLFGALQKAVGGAIRGRVVAYTIFSVLLLIYTGSLAILDVERHQLGSQINNFGDALWWSISTVTTAGGSTPVSVAGRTIAVLLMIGGISLLGLVTATLASWIIQRVAEEDASSQAVTAAQIEALQFDMQQRIDALTAELKGMSSANPIFEPSSKVINRLSSQVA